MILYQKILVKILPSPPVTNLRPKIVVNVTPSATGDLQTTVVYPFVFDIKPIVVNMSTPIIQTAYQFLNDIISDFIDEDRELKTLLNYGEDKQSVILAQRYGPIDQDGVRTVQLKLLQPVPNDIQQGTSVFLSREVANSVIDSVRVRFAPPIDTTPYLRPKNTSVKINDQLGKSLNNVTMRLLAIDTGSVGGYQDVSNNITFENQVYRRWYSDDFNSSELNIDFTDYNNFVFYGSSAMRLSAFKQKLKQIESLTSASKQFEGSVFTGSLATAGASYIMEQSAKFAKQREDIIRAFDRYEQFLYFTPSGSVSPYSASAYYADGGYEYNSISYWPKDSLGNIASPYSTLADNWYTTQSLIAQRFDDFNENNLINTIPTHIREDEESDAYITFIAMMGHFFDTIKPYIDQFPNVYSRYIGPDEELSKDLVADIAESVGFKLPTLNSIYSLSDNVIGTTSVQPRRDFTVETHKRLLHNIPLFAKSKGTRTALITLLKSFGINDQLINVKETGTAESSSLYVFDEFTTGLDFDAVPNTYIKLPVVDSNRIPAVRSLQFNLTVAEARDMTVLTGDSRWALHVRKHPTNASLGRFELTSGSAHAIILSSSYEPIFGDELLNVTIRTYNTGSYANLFVTQVDGEDVIFSSSMSETFGANKFVPLWTASSNIQLGGSGSLVIGYYNGTVDEVRLWGTNLSNEMTINTAFDPGSNAGDVYSDASDYLYVQLSFNKINTGSLPTYLVNESPYKFIDGSPSLENIEVIGTIDLNSFSRYSRSVRQLLPETGYTGYVTRKIKIAPAATFTPENIGGDGVKQLSRTRSIVNPAKKKVQVGRNKVSISTSPTDIINQNIIRSLGLENINTVLGAPTDLYTNFNKTLDVLKRHYSQYYYVDVNINQYIRILSEVNSVLNQVVQYFIPSKATLLKGVVIEPNILERVKVPVIRNIRFYGADTRKTKNAAASLTGSGTPDYEATFNLSQKINAITTQSVLGLYETFETQHENWYDAKLISQSIKPSRPSKIDITYNKDFAANYNTYDRQAEDWYNSKLISQSLKTSRPSTIIIDTATNSAEIAVIDTQHEDWYKSFLISQSNTPNSSSGQLITRTPIPTRKVSITLEREEESGVFSTYELKHEDWYTAKLISQSLKPARKVAIQTTNVVDTAEYITYDRQHENWYRAFLISQSQTPQSSSGQLLPRNIVPTRPSAIYPVEGIFGQYDTVDLQHLDWAEFRKVSSSYVSGTIEWVSQSYLPHKKQRIDIGLADMNKIPYNDTNYGSEGAEPYNRVYPRKLFEYEIEKERPGGVTSLYTNALYEIPPSCDFSEIGTYTYFNSPAGIYYYPETYYFPKYTQPLNQSWDFDNQQFIGITTWSYGQRYNYNDVVYQEVSEYASYSASLGGEIIRAARGGNKKYYVFSTRPAYTNPTDGTAFFSGSVPTYLPPSLDGNNWKVLGFSPIEIRQPKRVVFDTFVIPDPSLNNYITTTIGIDRIIDVPDRYIDVRSIGNIAPASYVRGELQVQNIAALFALQSENNELRVRLYRTDTSRDADITRPHNVFPAQDSGVLIDMAIGQANTAINVNPIVTLVADAVPPLGKLYYTVDNLGSTTKVDVSLTLFYFALQVEPRVPAEYLRKHYRFFRDNSTATKRRNYLGCKNTEETTIDGLPPIQIFYGEGTDLVVSPTTQNKEIITGGGGTLSAT